MKKFLGAALFLLLPSLLYANNGPGPQVILAEISVLPVMMFFTFLGGGYALLKSRFITNRWGLNLLFAVLAILFSFGHEGFAFLGTMLFGAFALLRAGQLLVLAVKKPESASRGRLLCAGILLIPCTLLPMGTAFCFVNYWPVFAEKDKESSLKTFVAYQLAYAEKNTSQAGKKQFDLLNKEDLMSFFGPAFRQDRYTREKNPLSGIEISYKPDQSGFQIYIAPAGLPPFPYNYMIDVSSYYADESGAIRMIYVHHAGEKCPPSAPILFHVERADIDGELKNLK